MENHRSTNNEVIWTKYESSRKLFQHEKSRKCVNWFTIKAHERYYQQCLEVPLSKEVQQCMPVLTVPLQITLVRCQILGCSNELNMDNVKKIVDEMNERYWAPQAHIYFQLTDTKHCSLDHICIEKKKGVRNYLKNELSRNSGKRKRKEIFLGKVMKPYIDKSVYEIWFYDMIGMGFQGCCISRDTYTIIMGERSSKGYPFLTKRPHSCLSKTMAHELGHALGLDHPRGKFFEFDGSAQCVDRVAPGEDDSKRNLMCGGVDLRGGGGSYLEPWQICLARDNAENFLNRLQFNKA